MTAWAKPADLLVAYKYASPNEWRKHIAWLETEGYPHVAQLREAIERAHKKAGQPVGHPQAGGREALGGVSTPAELASEVPEVGDDLLAGGA